MDKFLKEVALWLANNHKHNFQGVNVIFPNRRAGVFFTSYLSEIIANPQFSPKVFTISEVVSKIAQLQVADQNMLIIELYKVYCSITKSTETLDDFYYWGEMLLSDFNDIDKYLIDAKQLFGNIQSLKEIDMGFDFLTKEQLEYISAFWSNILLTRTSDNKDQFLSLWKNLFSIYSLFNAKLTELGIAYEGLVYRKMVELLPNQQSFSDTAPVLIVGFNALNECEIKLFNYLKTNRNASFFWDTDDYYLNNQHHEAGMFMRQNLFKFPHPLGFNPSTNNFFQPKSIDVVAVPGFSGQATFAANWLNNHTPETTTRFDNTALVLCDENLLMPMLNTLPDNIKELNITMGYPVKSSPAFALIRSLIDIDRNARKDTNGYSIFYYRNVLALLNNPLIGARWKDEIDELIKTVKTENKIYIQKADFGENTFLSSLFNLPETPEQCNAYIQHILLSCFSWLGNNEHLMKESIYQLHLALNQIHDAIFLLPNENNQLLSKRLYYQLMIKQLERLNIPFEGELLSGMQLMGFLETRCLDFDNLVLLSFNDDRLPGNPHQHSFIPYSLRKGFGLPAIEQRNAMYAYYFYRLIQRAKNVTLVYDSRTEGLTNGEVSRYVTQLKFEAQHIRINELQAKFDFEPALSLPIVIQKNEELLAKLENHFQLTRISPSALNTYIDCSLKFYFTYIEKIKPADEVSEEIDQLLFGRIAHVTLEELYKPFLGQIITPEIIKKLIEDKKTLNLCLQNALAKEFFKKGQSVINGSNLLVYDIIRKYVVRILSYDKNIAPFQIIGLEQTFESHMELQSSNKTIKIKYGGVVDRIDQVNDTIRVVDYKTGKSDDNVVSIEKLFKYDIKRNKAAFQTMLYAGCVAEALDTNLPVMPAVYGARSVFTTNFDPLFSFDGGKLIYQSHEQLFKENLAALFLEILSPSMCFEQTKNQQLCKLCEYNVLCNR